MIRMEGHRIRRVFGADGDFTVKPDKDAGTAYIQPTTDKPVFSAFVVDDTGRTWKLLLSLTDGLSDTIVIKGKGEPSVARAGGKDLARNQAIKRVVLALGRTRKPTWTRGPPTKSCRSGARRCSCW